MQISSDCEIMRSHESVAFKHHIKMLKTMKTVGFVGWKMPRLLVLAMMFVGVIRCSKATLTCDLQNVFKIHFFMLGTVYDELLSVRNEYLHRPSVHVTNAN